MYLSRGMGLDPHTKQSSAEVQRSYDSLDSANERNAQDTLQKMLSSKALGGKPEKKRQQKGRPTDAPSLSRPGDDGMVTFDQPEVRCASLALSW